MTTTNIDPQAHAAAVIGGLTGPGGPFELAEQDVLGARMPVIRHRKRSLTEIFDDAERFADRDYLVTETQRISFAEHAQRVRSLAQSLRDDYGIRKGDRVAILAANSPEWIETFWATELLGAITVGFNAWWTRSEIEYALNHSTPKLVVADAKRRTVLGEIDTPTISLDDDIVAMATAHPDATTPDVELAEDDPAVILYTSGTSGRPKGAVATHRNLIAVIDYHRFNDALLAAFTGAELDPPRRYLLTSPLFHIASLHNLAVPRLATGSAVVIHQGSFDADRVLALIERERVTNWGPVPTMAKRLLDTDIERYDLSSLTGFALASAPSSIEFQERLRERLPVARVALADSYGMTETCTAIAVATSADLEATPGTLGRPILVCALEIRDPLGDRVPDSVEGEICVRSPYVMLGYWNDPAATSAAIDDDRWLRTGDLGVLEHGMVRLSTRRSDLIIRGGENIYPTEVEQCLDECPGVLESVVLAIPDDDYGQIVGAVVVADPAHAITEDILRDFIADRLARFKQPTVWQITGEPLPRNATGKIMRKHVAFSN
ncbi:class I adenylate-forming enzyme family protein [Gordonia sp. CPCC 205515]|uniref:class I adenylate-forming enzyme family protein n=1 Tax=Gordonia sp. CPCC 205515 TaxID=3140791 RepID=UPI003AF3F781